MVTRDNRIVPSSEDAEEETIKNRLSKVLKKFDHLRIGYVIPEVSPNHRLGANSLILNNYIYDITYIEERKTRRTNGSLGGIFHRPAHPEIRIPKTNSGIRNITLVNIREYYHSGVAGGKLMPGKKVSCGPSPRVRARKRQKARAKNNLQEDDTADGEQPSDLSDFLQHKRTCYTPATGGVSEPRPTITVSSRGAPRALGRRQQGQEPKYLCDMYERDADWKGDEEFGDDAEDDADARSTVSPATSAEDETIVTVEEVDLSVEEDFM
ncbi:hypothetical protein B0H65DRAFT_439436 [Neurospora tetraspora]|uniref:Uncharacterized protein n=1 Tax=Neurospora tetraspora TaxID=94610 RepID=A0AAE0MTH4_9PEZI|nr:hypothetical protein B0H65DRAFT_439436 [Neurospora tetraspora]